MLRATDGRTFFPAAEAEFYLDDICGITDQAGRVEFRNIGSVDRVITVPDGYQEDHIAGLMAEILEFVNDSVFSLIGLAEPELYTLSADANNSDILDDGRIIFYPNNGRNNQMRKFWRTRTCKKTKLGPRPCGSGETTPRSDMKDNAERREG